MSNRLCALVLAMVALVAPLRSQPASAKPPSADPIDTFVAARARGVRVEIIVPGEHTDVKITRRASRGLCRPILHDAQCGDRRREAAERTACPTWRRGR